MSARPFPGIPSPGQVYASGPDEYAVTGVHLFPLTPRAGGSTLRIVGTVNVVLTRGPMSTTRMYKVDAAVKWQAMEVT